MVVILKEIKQSCQGLIAQYLAMVEHTSDPILFNALKVGGREGEVGDLESATIHLIQAAEKGSAKMNSKATRQATSPCDHPTDRIRS